MKRTILILSIFASIGVACAQQGSTTAIKKMEGAEAVVEDVHKIDGSNLEDEISLSGQDVLITGSDNKITIKGNIGKLTISGKNNEIDVQTVKSIQLTGDYNFVSWQASQNSSGKPSITDKGGYNNVGRKTVNALDKKDD